jgi:DNA-binding beta-propeller fold protein YncE
MTYILGSKCKDGIALIADKKIVYDDYRINYQEKLFKIDDSIVLGYSGAVSLFDTFRERIYNIIRGYRETKNYSELIKELEENTKKINNEYEYKVHHRNFDVLVAIKSAEFGTTLKYIYPEGHSENISNYKVIGDGEPFGLIFLRALWHPNISMMEVAELGYRIIAYIEKLDLNNSVGVGNNRSQILFMTNDGSIKEASDSLLDRLEISCKNWLERYKVSIKEIYKPALTVDGYIFIRKWGTRGTNKGQFYYSEGIDIDSLGNVYVAAEQPHCVQKFDKNGEFITSFGTEGIGKGQFKVPYALAIDSFDNVYVSESDNARIQKFDSNGEFILMWGNRGTSEGQFEAPLGLCVDSSKAIYVTDEVHDSIQKFDSNGEFITKWGSEGSDSKQFNHPIGITTDSENNVYVADHLNHRIQKFDSNGEFILMWGKQGDGDGDFNRPHGVTFDSDKLYVSDSLNHRIQVFTSEGTFITKWGSAGKEDGQLNIPRDLVVDGSDNVYVSDGSNHRIQVFAPAWKRVHELDLFNEAK